MTTLTYEPENTTASPAISANGEHSISPIPATDELFFVQRGWLPRDQEYYWTEEWQAGEQESRAELTAGGGVRFENAEDAIRWLMRTDED